MVLKPVGQAFGNGLSTSSRSSSGTRGVDRF